ncbi:hypothetical protein KGB37_gp66 [Escherichia phage vB_EcoS Sa179lw]|uniref:Uncharacterized protein n=1 Tax=Escherichia phage vB_EcoS Sa179lw TaxID=2126819 RepID=A0A2P1MXE8_9CAUD|nr:hypothetical protein KGB37_gp66 [Escherichia phage vB_EcoS Sa179lw]AVP40251.1 hypothetical protein vBEcoSSa179w3YLVW_00066 [Escherichia phage vB_EcoS Sa179lw]
MKLIDMLVQELPKRGGWPDGALSITQDDDGSLCVWDTNDPHYDGFSWKHHTGNSLVYYWHGIEGVPLSCDHRESIVTYWQYKAALAASQKPAWNGEGLPPVGEKVEFFINPKIGYRNAWIPDAGTEMEVVAHKTTTDGNNVAVCYWDERGAGRSCCFVPESLKPAITEAERKRDAAVEAMQREADEGDNWIYSEYEIIYDAIAAGKIPGVKLDD